VATLMGKSSPQVGKRRGRRRTSPQQLMAARRRCFAWWLTPTAAVEQPSMMRHSRHGDAKTRHGMEVGNDGQGRCNDGRQ
jgi:hypothetical protein